MAERWEKNFDALLAWFDADRERAGLKYEEIRQNLIYIFSWRGFGNAEDLADETFIRVTGKVVELAKRYQGDPVPYFQEVARRLCFETSRKDRRMTSLSADDTEYAAPEANPDDFEAESECLDCCLKELTQTDRELILLYYQQEQPKIAYRKKLARQLGTSQNNLRVKAHRIRTVLLACMEKCLKKGVRAETETN